MPIDTHTLHSAPLKLRFTWIHDMVSANGAVVDVNVYTQSVNEWVRECLPQAQRATAFHFLTSNLFYVADSTMCVSVYYYLSYYYYNIKVTSNIF